MREFVSRLVSTKLLRRTSEQSAGSSASVSSPGDEAQHPPSTSPQVTDRAITTNIAAQEETLSKLSDRGPTEGLDLHDLQPLVDQPKTVANQAIAPTVIVQRPTPPTLEDEVTTRTDSKAAKSSDRPRHIPLTPGSTPSSPAAVSALGKDSSEPQNNTSKPLRHPVEEDYFGDAVSVYVAPVMPKKIWVKRPGASATLVPIGEDDLVDDVRDMILRKYANSLGRSFDSPDVSLRIVPREESHKTADRTLGPEEPILKTLEAYFPGGQVVGEALIIDVPRQRTPKPSPGLANHHHHGHVSSRHEDHRPTENGNDYFPPMPIPMPASPAPVSMNPQESRQAHHHPTSNPHAISVLETGQIPPLPSPRERKSHRPKYARQHTSSPTAMAAVSMPPIALHHQPRQGRPRHDSSISEQKHSTHLPAAAPLPTPPLNDNAANTFGGRLSNPTTPRMASPRPPKNRRSRKPTNGNESLLQNGQAAYTNIPGLDGSVPPINVLIVEDNPINLRLLEAFVKRLKVRWQTAVNGRDAVTKWRSGGFHLVLMDIQLPIMSGLEATKEIRRLERVNGIGVFARSEGEDRSSTPVPGKNENATEAEADGHAKKDDAATTQEADKLQLDGLLKSPVIIVALTASSLQSDRHEALAAGCNDFLTKPVSFPWFERKVMEWGCMQALIDFDGWRTWKDFAATAKDGDKKGEKKDGAANKNADKEAKRASLKATAPPVMTATPAVGS